MTETATPRLAPYVPEAIVSFGLLVFAIDYALGVSVFGFDGMLSVPGMIGTSMTAGFCSGIVVGGVWLHRSDVEPSRYPRVAAWVVGFVVVFVALNVPLMVLFPSEGATDLAMWALYLVYAGACGGTVVGVVEARATQRAVDAEREAVHAEHVEAQRKWLDYLNSLLRHEVLNNATIIQGYSSLLLEEDIDAEYNAHLEKIHHQSQDMTDVVKDVRVLIQATDAAEEFEPFDLGSLLEEELSDLTASYPEADTDLTVEGRPTVEADGLLPRAFSNLLSNAVEHNPGPEPRVDVTVQTGDDRVHVHVADDGPGIPESEQEDLFQRGGGDHGLGLYLVRVLVERYGGSVDLSETGPEGSAFVVDLPLAGGKTAADRDPDAAAEADRLVPSPSS